MSQYPVENIRTVALVGHGSTGKTTLMEALLYRNGVIKEVGTVEKGNTVGDFDPMEKEVGHSLRTTVAHLNAQKDDGTPVRVFLLDTPGYPDCVGQALGALDAVMGSEDQNNGQSCGKHRLSLVFSGKNMSSH